MNKFNIIVAVDQKGGIGKENSMPWHNPEDLRFFQEITNNSMIIMGRKTWESLPTKPLKNRINVIVSHDYQTKYKDVIICDSLEKALCLKTDTKVFVIGGSEIYKQSFNYLHNCVRLYLTQIQHDFNCDRFFPDYTQGFYLAKKSDTRLGMTNVLYNFLELIPYNQNSQEIAYLKCIYDIIDTGVHKNDRTGVGTISKFGVQMRFDLSESFPLLTTKKVNFRLIAEELLWFIRGCTDSNELSKKKVRIWDANGSREFLDNLGFTEREAGDLGPVYGFQWRHSGAKYVDHKTDYTGQGIDQLQNCIDMIRNDPNSRRIIMNSWNPSDLGKMALPPCHTMCQFYVADKKLSCQLYQRSGDMGLGVPFNIASYALLTYMVASVTGLQPGEFVHVIGDAHVYSNHVKALTQQIQRTPLYFPKLKITHKENINDFVMEDFQVQGYVHHPILKMKMAV